MIVEQSLIAGRHLSQQFFAMAKELQHELACPVCLWTPCTDCIDKAMVVRLCGHVQCACCMLAQMTEGDGKTECPVCRA